MESTFYSRRRYWILWLFLLGLPAILWGTWWAILSNTNRVEDWLPEDFEETQQLIWFAREFGSDELLMISWPGCTVDDPRLAKFAKRLRMPPEGGSKTAAPATWASRLSAFFLPRKPLDKPLFREVITGPEAAAELQVELEKVLSPAAARRQTEARLAGWIVGKDDPQQTCAVALVSVGADRHAAVDYVYSCAAEVGLARKDVHVAGTSIEGVAIDRASSNYLMPLNAASYSICVLLMLLSFRSVWLSLLLFSNAMFSQILSVAIVYYCGGQMDSVLLMVPSLVYVLSISGGVHLINYYRDAIDEGGLEGAPSRAVGYALAPCALAAATTALGLWSLMVSKLVPIRNFGFYAAIGVLAGTAVLLLLLPWQLEHFPPRRWARRKPHQSSGRVWHLMAALMQRGHWAVAVLGMVLLVVGGYGVSRISASARVHDMFSPQAKVLKDYDWLEHRIGPLIPIEVVVRIPIRKDEQRYNKIVEHLSLVERVRHAVEQVEGIGASASAATYLPPLPAENRGLRYVLYKGVLKAKLENPANRQRLIGLSFLSETADEELWRVSARVNAGDRIDYGRLVRDLHQRLPPLFRAAEKEGMPGVSAIVTGGVPVVYKAQDQLIKDLIWSFGCAFGLIAVAMIVLFSFSSMPAPQPATLPEHRPDGVVTTTRNVIAGLLSMIPNLLPAVMVFGVMGLAGIQIEVGTMLTASAALGIAVDDTLHYVTWFRRGLSEGMDRRQAVEFAYRRCGNAMIQTTAICGLGLLVFALSPFGPICRFAWMMFSMLASALVGDLVVLPAILIGPLGRVFHPHPTTAAVPLVSAERETATSEGAVVHS